MGSFSPAGSLIEARTGHSATLLADGRVLVVGGTPGNDPFDEPIRSAEIWDPDTMSFRPAGSLYVGRSNHSSTLLDDGRVVVMGGLAIEDGLPTAVAEIEIWDPGSETFGVASPLAYERGAHTATLLTDGRILVVGGFAYSDLMQRSAVEAAEMFTPSSGR